MQQPFPSGTLHVPILMALCGQNHWREFGFSRFHSCIAFQLGAGGKRAIEFSYDCNIICIELLIYIVILHFMTLFASLHFTPFFYY